MALKLKSQRNVAYGLSNPLQSLAPMPIVANRAPTVNDSAPVSTLWVYPASDTVWCLTSIVAGSATWTQLS